MRYRAIRRDGRIFASRSITFQAGWRLHSESAADRLDAFGHAYSNFCDNVTWLVAARSAP